MQPGQSTERAVVVVRAEGLCKRCSDALVLDDVSFTIGRGRVFGLIGPNGAGKTTTIKLLLGLLRADAGRVEVLGESPPRLSIGVRQRIGYLSERPELPNLPIADLLEYQACFFDAWDHDHCQRLRERLQVVDDRPIHASSEGERRRAELLVALAHRPELLILDDPALGLDALARRRLLHASLDAAREEGTTVLFTSHVLQDVERVVDDVLILDRGVVRLQGPLEDVLARARRLVFPDAVQEPPPIPGEAARTRYGRDVAVVTTAVAPSELERLRRAYPFVRDEPINLEEIFCALVAQAPEGTEAVAADGTANRGHGAERDDGGR